MNIKHNKDKIAIVVVGYNRLDSIKRLLRSLELANYYGDDVALVVSIDASGKRDLYEYVNAYKWDYGPYYVNIQEERLGLKQHILQCGGITKFFKAIVLLEDDIVVSPYFYNFVKQSVKFYEDDDKIAEISLYKNEINGFVQLPFEPRHNGADVFLMQDVSTWGECWTEKMWSSFMNWYNEHDEDCVESIRMPVSIKRWTRAWSKYYYAYIIDTQKYVLFPHVSLSTNYSEAGEHDNAGTSSLQTNMLYGEKEYTFRESNALEKYDVYCNNVVLYDYLDIEKQDVQLDIYGFGELDDSKRFLLTTKILPYKIVKTYSLSLRPIEQNIIGHTKGEGIYIYDTNQKINRKRGDNPFLAYYFIRGLQASLIIKYIKTLLKVKLRRKLKL